MSKEIERKFLVKDNSFVEMASESHRIRQGYISRRKEGTVRVRTLDHRGFLTVKGATHGIERHEWEFEIPYEDANEMFSTVCEPGLIDKTRHIVDYMGYRWEIDEFHGSLSPLVVAEVELPSAETEPPLPPFVGMEVSDDPAYYNSNLLQKSVKAQPR